MPQHAGRLRGLPEVRLISCGNIMLRPITIVGGGLAGLTLGIALRRWSIPVTVWESGRYPRHRVCGEFISGHGQQVLDALGLKPVLEQAGAAPGRTAAFFLGCNESPVRLLSPPAWCVSRFRLDALLAAHFRHSGGELREAARWAGAGEAEGAVFATGRRAQAIEDGWRWCGLKVHATGVRLNADLEMHGSPDQYVGVCRLADNQVNVCGLFRRRSGARLASPDWRQMLLGDPGTPLRERLENATFDETSFRAVAGLPLRPARARGRTECCIGDALTMIPPVTGNGMSMAFEAAELAVPPLTAWSRGGLEWAEAKEAIARACDRAFGPRLVWARCLHQMMFSSPMQRALGAVALRQEWLWNWLFSVTR